MAETTATGPDLAPWVRPGDTIVWGQATAEPRTLTHALVAQRHAFARLRVFVGIGASPTLQPEHADAFDFVGYSASGTHRALADAGVLDILPCHYSQLPELLRSGPLRIDVVMLQVSPPDAQGRHSLGLAQEYLLAALDAAQVQLQRSRIVAPIGGRIEVSTVSPGALVTANQTAALTQITQLDPMHVDITQSSTEVLRLQRDLAAGHFERLPSGAAQVRIVLEDGSVYPHAATLKFEGVNVNTSTGAITLRAQVPNPDRVLLPGMYVRASLTTGLVPNALLVPQQAVKQPIEILPHPK